MPSVIISSGRDLPPDRWFTIKEWIKKKPIRYLPPDRWFTIIDCLKSYPEIYLPPDRWFTIPFV